ncbi:MAG: DUF6404 family protein [Moritella sp.]|uniref:DUF6404 family protein n=1 Tax=Moritella sp. TaxID=78556 RepID=UPI0029A188F4|nr:DUF6404 family protein [Moritella sp.]MDX2321738.1 DUF6404 family protein [Moritella sp.]
MSSDKDVNEYLMSLGASHRDVKPYPVLFYKLTGKKGKPRLFENPIKLFLLQSIIGAISWGSVMWLALWQFQGSNIVQLYVSIFFGVSTGAILAFQVKVKSKHLGLTQWENWLEENSFKSK